MTRRRARCWRRVAATMNGTSTIIVRTPITSNTRTWSEAFGPVDQRLGMARVLGVIADLQDAPHRVPGEIGGRDRNSAVTFGISDKHGNRVRPRTSTPTTTAWVSTPLRLRSASRLWIAVSTHQGRHHENAHPRQKEQDGVVQSLMSRRHPHLLSTDVSGRLTDRRADRPSGLERPLWPQVTAGVRVPTPSAGPIVDNADSIDRNGRLVHRRVGGVPRVDGRRGARHGVRADVVEHPPVPGFLPRGHVHHREPGQGRHRAERGGGPLALRQHRPAPGPQARRPRLARRPRRA